MHHPCSNLACSAAIAPSDLKARRETGLCWLCRRRWQMKGIPTGGHIPSDASGFPTVLSFIATSCAFDRMLPAFPTFFAIILKLSYLR